MSIGLFFKLRRERMGLGEAVLAASIRPDFPPGLIWDFERGGDDNLDGWLLRDFKRYCEALGLRPTAFADAATRELAHLPLREMVRRRREQKRWTVAELAQRCGYEPAIVEALEAGRADTEVCIDALRSVGAELDLPFRLLLEKI